MSPGGSAGRRPVAERWVSRGGTGPPPSGEGGPGLCSSLAPRQQPAARARGLLCSVAMAIAAPPHVLHGCLTSLREQGPEGTEPLAGPRGAPMAPSSTELPRSSSAPRCFAELARLQQSFVLETSWKNIRARYSILCDIFISSHFNF